MVKAASGGRSKAPVETLGPLASPAARRVWGAFVGVALFVACGNEPRGESPSAEERSSIGSPARSAAPVGSPPGKWRQARPSSGPEQAVDSKVEDLKAIPYLQGYREAEDRPVISSFDRSAAQLGWNFYVSGHAAEATLMDMDGRVEHRWKMPLRRLWPELSKDPEAEKLEYFRRALPLPNGDLFAIYEGYGIVRLDAASRVIWAHRGGIHHDLELVGDELIVLDREGKLLPRINQRKGVLEDFVTVLDAQTGRVLRRWSLLEAFERSPRYRNLLDRMPKEGDIFHTNTLEVLDGRFADRDPAFRRGNVLISVLKLDALAIIDPERHEVVWARTGSWRAQHQPTLLPSGDLLLFDNTGAGPGRSRVLELEPLTGRVTWSYGDSQRDNLFSKTLGSCQRLQNGNTLITESENGRAVEIDRKGRVVWEFNSPQRAGDGDALVAVLFEMVRLPASFPRPTEAGARARTEDSRR